MIDLEVKMSLTLDFQSARTSGPPISDKISTDGSADGVYSDFSTWSSHSRVALVKKFNSYAFFSISIVELIFRSPCTKSRDHNSEA